MSVCAYVCVNRVWVNTQDMPTLKGMKWAALAPYGITVARSCAPTIPQSGHSSHT